LKFLYTTKDGDISMGDLANYPLFNPRSFVFLSPGGGGRGFTGTPEECGWQHAHTTERPDAYGHPDAIFTAQTVSLTPYEGIAGIEWDEKHLMTRIPDGSSKEWLHIDEKLGFVFNRFGLSNPGLDRLVISLVAHRQPERPFGISIVFLGNDEQSRMREAKEMAQALVYHGQDHSLLYRSYLNFNVSCPCAPGGSLDGFELCLILDRLAFVNMPIVATIGLGTPEETIDSLLENPHIWAIAVNSSTRLFGDIAVSYLRDIYGDIDWKEVVGREKGDYAGLPFMEGGISSRKLLKYNSALANFVLKKARSLGSRKLVFLGGGIATTEDVRIAHSQGLDGVFFGESAVRFHDPNEPPRDVMELACRLFPNPDYTPGEKLP
jgi:hypothetical protein